MTDRRAPQDLDEELFAAELPSVASEITDEQRVARMRDELAGGFDAMEGIGQAVAVFGSARTPEGSDGYALAQSVGRALGEAGFTVITGGGPGASSSSGPRSGRGCSTGCATRDAANRQWGPG